MLLYIIIHIARDGIFWDKDIYKKSIYKLSVYLEQNKGDPILLWILYLKLPLALFKENKHPLLYCKKNASCKSVFFVIC